MKFAARRRTNFPPIPTGPNRPQPASVRRFVQPEKAQLNWYSLAKLANLPIQQ